MARRIYNCDALTGGGTYALDYIHISAGKTLSDGDFAIVSVSNRTYFFRYSSSSSSSEQTTSHPYTVTPDDAGGTGRWIETTVIAINTDALDISNSVDLYPLDLAFSRAGHQYARILNEGNYDLGFKLVRNEGGGSYNTTWVQYVSASQTYLSFYNGGHVLRLYDTGDVDVAGDLTADSYADHTPVFAGNACDAIKSIAPVKGSVSANQWGEMDHDTLPAGVLVEKTERDKNDKPVTVKRRNLSNMVSLQAKAIQELLDRVESLEAQLAEK